MQDAAQQRKPKPNQEINRLEALLQQPGDQNQELEQILENADHQDFSQPIEIDTGEENICAPCGINRYPFDDVETILQETEDHYLVGAEDKKGHEIRNMAVTKQHGEIPAIEEATEMIDKLVETTATHVLHKYSNNELETPDFTLYGSMNTFSEHFHLVASDAYGDLEPEDLESIHSFLKFEYHDEEGYQLNTDKSRIRDSFGEYLERWTENTEKFGLE